MSKKNIKKKRVENITAGVVWIFVAFVTLFSGIGLWSLIGINLKVSGVVAAGFFALLALSSAVGIGSIVGFCVKQARKELIA